MLIQSNVHNNTLHYSNLVIATRKKLTIYYYYYITLLLLFQFVVCFYLSLANSSRVPVITVSRGWDHHPVVGHGQEGDKAEERKVQGENENPKDDRFPPNVTTAPIPMMMMVVVEMMIMVMFTLQTWLLVIMLEAVSGAGTAAAPAPVAKEAVADSAWRPQKFCHVAFIFHSHRLQCFQILLYSLLTSHTPYGYSHIRWHYRACRFLVLSPVPTISLNQLIYLNGILLGCPFPLSSESKSGGSTHSFLLHLQLISYIFIP